MCMCTGCQFIKLGCCCMMTPPPTTSIFSMVNNGCRRCPRCPNDVGLQAEGRCMRRRGRMLQSWKAPIGLITECVEHQIIPVYNCTILVAAKSSSTNLRSPCISKTATPYSAYLDFTQPTTPFPQASLVASISTYHLSAGIVGQIGVRARKTRRGVRTDLPYGHEREATGLYNPR